MGDDDDDIDRISELPDPILHMILSRLPPEPKDLVRTSVLSKRWRSTWLSLPYLDFEENFFNPEISVIDPETHPDREKGRKILMKRQEFIRYVDDTLSHRGHSNLSTQKLRLGICFPRNMSLASRLDQWIGYAIDANVEDLCLQFRSSTNNDLKYKLPEVLFTSMTLRILYLHFCRMEPNGDIRLPLLQKLSMQNVYIKEHTFQKLLSSCPKIDHLDLTQCRGLESNYSFSSPKLKHVKVMLFGRYEIGKVDVTAPYLECLRVYGNTVPCEINITSCSNLKELALTGSKLHGVTETYIQDLISKLPYLENLDLGDLFCLTKSIAISNPRLKIFKLYDRSNLVEVKIDAPNLVQFGFLGSYKTSILLLSTSSHLEVNLTLEAKELSNHWFVDLIEFFKKIDRCQALTLDVLSEMSIFIPKELREELLPSLYNVKQLKLIIRREPTSDTVSLVDGLLWICPRVEALSIVLKSDQHKHIEFVYGEQMNSDEGSYCCRSHHLKCWRHFLKKVNIVNFRENEAEKNLREYFIQNVDTVDIFDCS